MPDLVQTTHESMEILERIYETAGHLKPIKSAAPFAPLQHVQIHIESLVHLPCIQQQQDTLLNGRMRLRATLFDLESCQWIGNTWKGKSIENVVMKETISLDLNEELYFYTRNELNAWVLVIEYVAEDSISLGWSLLPLAHISQQQHLENLTVWQGTPRLLKYLNFTIETLYSTLRDLGCDASILVPHCPQVYLTVSTQLKKETEKWVFPENRLYSSLTMTDGASFTVSDIVFHIPSGTLDVALQEAMARHCTQLHRLQTKQKSDLVNVNPLQCTLLEKRVKLYLHNGFGMTSAQPQIVALLEDDRTLYFEGVLLFDQQTNQDILVMQLEYRISVPNPGKRAHHGEHLITLGTCILPLENGLDSDWTRKLSYLPMETNAFVWKSSQDPIQVTCHVQCLSGNKIAPLIEPVKEREEQEEILPEAEALIEKVEEPEHFKEWRVNELENLFNLEKNENLIQQQSQFTIQCLTLQWTQSRILPESGTFSMHFGSEKSGSFQLKENHILQAETISFVIETQHLKRRILQISFYDSNKLRVAQGEIVIANNGLYAAQMFSCSECDQGDGTLIGLLHFWVATKPFQETKQLFPRFYPVLEADSRIQCDLSSDMTLEQAKQALCKWKEERRNSVQNLQQERLKQRQESVLIEELYWQKPFHYVLNENENFTIQNFAKCLEVKILGKEIVLEWKKEPKAKQATVQIASDKKRLDFIIHSLKFLPNERFIKCAFEWKKTLDDSISLKSVDFENIRTVGKTVIVSVDKPGIISFYKDHEWQSNWLLKPQLNHTKLLLPVSPILQEIKVTLPLPATENGNAVLDLVTNAPDLLLVMTQVIAWRGKEAQVSFMWRRTGSHLVTVGALRN